MAKQPNPKEIEAITAAFFAQTNRLTDEVASFTSNQFKNLGNWGSSREQVYLQTVLPMIKAGQTQMSVLTRAYYAAIAKIHGQPMDPRRAPANLISVQGTRGATAEDVYSRGFVTVRSSLAEGKSLDKAVALGTQRVYNMARTDMQLAKTHTGLFVRNGNSNIVGYSRILSGAENCAMCYIASTQRYTRGNLLPIHPGCDCGEMPIYGNSDPGQIIDKPNLEATHEAVASRFGKAARDGREIDYRLIAVRNHGEIGPVLTVRDQKFTGPSSI